MKAGSLLLLRVSLGGLMLVWGCDKLVHVQHSVAVSTYFYAGLINGVALLHVLGVLQVLLGATIVAGFGRRFAYPVLLLVTGATTVAVWRSIVDPWGWVLHDTNVLFYPTLIIFAGGWVLYAFRQDDGWSLDARRSAR